jgi:uncharacterized protein (TIRG00374 family)
MNRISKRVVGALVGLALIAVLIFESGPAMILSNLKLIGGGLLAIIAIELVVDLFNTLGWLFTLSPNHRRGQFGRLFLVRLAGTAVNQALPVASLGGEPTKVFLLRSHVPTETAISSVVVSRFAFSVAKAIFIVVGIAATASLINLRPAIIAALIAGFLMTAGGILIFLVLQLRGLSSASARIVARLRIPRRWISSISQVSPQVDEQIAEFYRCRRGDLVAAILSHQAAFLCGVSQVLLLLGWMGLARDWRVALAIESLSTLFGFATFLVPESLGIKEGGLALTFSALALPVSAGLAVAIAFRITSLVVTLAGLLVMSALLTRMPADTAKPLEQETGRG